VEGSCIGQDLGIRVWLFLPISSLFSFWVYQCLIFNAFLCDGCIHVLLEGCLWLYVVLECFVNFVLYRSYFNHWCALNTVLSTKSPLSHYKANCCCYILKALVKAIMTLNCLLLATMNSYGYHFKRASDVFIAI